MLVDSSNDAGLRYSQDCRLLRAGEPLCTNNLSMGLTIGSRYKQELSSVYQFIDVLYNLRSWVALL